MMMMSTTTTMMTDAVSCYIELHGYGMENIPVQPDWYRAVALNGVQYMNVSHSSPYVPGIHTYNVDAVSCGASDYQYFDTLNDDSASSSFISYLQALANGSLFKAGRL